MDQVKKLFRAFLWIGLICLAHSDEIFDSENDQTENSRITNLSIDIPSQENEKHFDFENNFPDNFTVNYNKYGDEFNIGFIKINESDPAYPITNSNVYVIDKKTGKPVVHRLQANKEVRENLQFKILYL